MGDGIGYDGRMELTIELTDEQAERLRARAEDDDAEDDAERFTRMHEFIGGHAEAAGLTLLTRDAKRFATYFPDIDIADVAGADAPTGPR